MFGTIRPPSPSFAFHDVYGGSSSDGSCPRSASRTGCTESCAIRYWYHEISQAIVTTTSGLTPDSATTDTLGSPRLFAIPPIVRRYCEALKASAASTIASSGCESLRRIGSGAIGSDGAFAVPINAASESRRRRRRSGETVGVVGAPSFTQPYSSAVSWQSGQTST